MSIIRHHNGDTGHLRRAAADQATGRVLRAPIHTCTNPVDLSPEGEGGGEVKDEDEASLDAIKQPCEVIQPNELCCAGGDVAVDANGDGEDLELDEAARRPPLRLLHLITAKVKGEEYQTPQPLSFFSSLLLFTALSPAFPQPQHYDLLLPSGPTPSRD